MSSKRATLLVRDFLRDLKISTKISILLGLTLLLMIFVIGFSLRQINIMRKEITTIVEENIPLIEAQSKITFHSQEQSIHFERAIQFGKFMSQGGSAKGNFEIERKNFLRHGRMVAEEIENNRAFIEQMHEKHKTPKTRDILLRIDYQLRSIDKEYADYQFLSERVLNLLSRGKLKDAEPVIQKVVRKSEEKVSYFTHDRSLENFSSLIEEFIAYSTNQVKKKKRAVMIGMSSFSFLVLLCNITLGVIISRGIRKSMHQAVNVANEIAKGEKSPKIEVSSKNEVGLLLTALKDMSAALSNADAEVNERNGQLEAEVEQRTSAQETLEERIKEINCLYSLSKLVERPEIPLGAIFQEATSLIRNAYQYPDITCVRITFEGIPYKTDNFDKNELSQHAQIKVGGEKAGEIEVYYLGEKVEAGESPFLQEERDLLDAVAEHLGRIAERRKTGEKLQLFRNLIDQSNDCIFLIEPEWGRFLDANDRTCASLGYTREELLTMSFKDIEESIRDESAWQQQAEELKLKTDLVIEGRHKRKDATTFDAETSLKYVSQGKEEYIIAVARDVTERKQAEEKLKQAAGEWITTFNSITDLVSIQDKDFKLVRVNKAFADAFKAKPEELIGKHCYEIIHGTKEPPAFCPHKQTLDTKKPQTAEFFEPHLGIYVEASTSPIFDENGDIIASVHITKDITERKHAEEKQAGLLETVESINKELKDFAYIVSHDLKAPLRGIKTLADWITTDYADMFDEEGRERVNLLTGRVVRMHNLIDGILQYSRVGREKVKRVRVNLNELVSEVIEMVAPPENIEITVENELPVFECEETRIMQVFQNLLSNAIKYMDKPRGQIKIGCVQEDGFWKFSVADNGPGIEEAHYERIFQIFQTLSPRDEVESTGVGLSVVKKIVELYGGKIWVESKPGEGSTFFFMLPKQESEVVDDAQLEANIVS